ncbi:MAG: TetR family transcriptional regulator [Mycobacterium sp.]|nr:TetR family transcriptional regulator [Mycobacterium sp.]
MPGLATDPTGLKILDAATRVLADYGVKRATVELVAKYASVSHMTVYRRWPSKGELLRSAVVRELSVLIASAFESAFESATEAGSFDETVRTAFGDVVWAVRNHPLVERQLNTDPEVLLGLVSTGSGSIMETAAPLVAEQLRLIADAGTTPDELDAIADVFVRLAHSLVLVQHPHHPLDTRADVASYVGRFFEPLSTSVPAVEADDETAVAPHPRIPRHRLQLAAASLLAVLLVGAGLSAIFVRQGDQPMSPDLIRTEQPSLSSAPPAEPMPVVPPVTTDPDTLVPGADPVPTVALPAAAEQSPSTSAAPAPTVRATTSRGSTGGAGGSTAAPPRPPNQFPAGPPPVFAPPHPPSGPGPSGPGPRPGSGPGGPGSAGHPSH